MSGPLVSRCWVLVTPVTGGSTAHVSMATVLEVTTYGTDGSQGRMGHRKYQAVDVDRQNDGDDQRGVERIVTHERRQRAEDRAIQLGVSHRATVESHFEYVGAVDRHDARWMGVVHQGAHPAAIRRWL
jgi:hypothetical protein